MRPTKLLLVLTCAALANVAGVAEAKKNDLLCMLTGSCLTPDELKQAIAAAEGQHDGDLHRWGGVFYLYGTSYDCGWTWNGSSTWCGIKVYTSTDLTHWDVHEDALHGDVYEHLPLGVGQGPLDDLMSRGLVPADQPPLPHGMMMPSGR